MPPMARASRHGLSARCFGPWPRTLRDRRVGHAGGDRARRTRHTPRRDWPTWLGVLTAIVTAVGALVFNAVSVAATGRQIELSRQAQLTDRYAKAVEQSSSDSIDLRFQAVQITDRGQHVRGINSRQGHLVRGSMICPAPGNAQNFREPA
jgi:hypothetical protein